MAAKCDICGSMAKKYFTASSGDTVCSKTCMNAYLLEKYLLSLEERREKDEELNKTAFNQAREMSAWLSIYRYGNKNSKKLATIAINAWAR